MRVTAVIALALASLVAAQQPSGTSGCGAVCPSVDGGSFHVDGTGTTDSSGNTVCSYPAYPGENDSDFQCEYNTVGCWSSMQSVDQ